MPDNTDKGHLNFNIYGYDPSLALGIIFVILFAVPTILHLVLTVKSRIWWLLVFVIGGLTEVIGWGGRLASAINVYSMNAFLTQIICLIIAPTFFSAACYGIFGSLIILLGRKYSLLPPLAYTLIFVTIDIASLVIQAIGGGSAAVALQDNKDSKNGTNIMLAGIVVQLVGMIVFSILALLYAFKVRRDPNFQLSKVSDADGKGGRRVMLLAAGLTVTTAMIILRGIYRTVELAQGWTGYTMTHEVFAVCLDSTPMVIAIAALVPTHPYFTLPGVELTHDDDATIVHEGGDKAKNSLSSTPPVDSEKGPIGEQSSASSS